MRQCIKLASVGLLVFALLTLIGCGGRGAGNPAAQPIRTEVTVSAAASLKQALTEAAGVYQRAHPEVEVSLNFASSGSLKKQIEQGAPVDVFLSAAQREMDSLQEQGLIDVSTRRDLLA
ncbi:MAG TPA: molybdate ABC transporter substrate-binding protein, partial [Firmicutes bacterium]|nr:molybdate ABC transporter substrate-binding protein [Bacillota bacterium]